MPTFVGYGGPPLLMVHMTIPNKVNISDTMQKSTIAATVMQLQQMHMQQIQ